MEKFVAVAAGLAVVGLAFFGGNFMQKDSSERTLSLPQLSLSFSQPILGGLPSWGESPSSLGREAFATFAQYREFARMRDIEGIRSLSHQLSDTCNDPRRIEDCNALMDNVYFFTEDFEEKDFKHIYYDERQIVMLTDFEEIEDAQAGAELVQTALFFTRTENGSPRVLGIKFCLPDEANPNPCFETDPTKRDLNGDGWWDQVEALFR